MFTVNVYARCFGTHLRLQGVSQKSPIWAVKPQLGISELCHKVLLLPQQDVVCS